MNVIEGLEISGMVLDVAENFNSLPGIKHWLDGRRRITTFYDGTYNRVNQWVEQSPRSRIFTSGSNVYAPIRGTNCVIFKPGATASPRHLLQTVDFVNEYKPIWDKPSKHGIFNIFKDVTGQLSASPNFLWLNLQNTVGGANTYNIYNNREGVGDPDSRFYLLRRYDGVNNLTQSPYSFQWQDQLTTSAQLITSEASNNLKFYVNNTLGFTASVNNTTPSVSPDVNNLSCAYITDPTSELQLFAQIICDWTPFTDVEATTYFNKGRVLLEQLKTEFL
jgi:hypothetical protein